MGTIDLRVAIKGIGVVGGFGCGIDSLHQTLSSGYNEPKMISMESKDRHVEIPVFLCDTSHLETFVNKRALRRVDHFSRMALLGAYLAFDDAGVASDVYENLAVVIATGYGATQTTFSFLDSIYYDGDTCASPTLFSNSVHNAAAAHVSILLKARGPTLTVSQLEMSVPSAMLSACQWLEDGQADAVLFGGVDEYCRVLGYSWTRFFGSSQKVNMRPLDWESQSAIAGEGSVFFLLTRDAGDSSKYGFISDIQVGNLTEHDLEIEKDTLVFLGADGHKSFGIQYVRNTPAGSKAVCYTPLYGSFPVGIAIDIAIAALSIKESKVFGTPKCVSDNSEIKLHRQEQYLEASRICCLKLGCSGEFGIIMLSRK